MLTKLFATVVVAIAAITLTAGFTQQAALVLRQEDQTHWARHGTQSAGAYRSGVWVDSPTRSSYSNFRGGGPGAGK